MKKMEFLVLCVIWAVAMTAGAKTGIPSFSCKAFLISSTFWVGSKSNDNFLPDKVLSVPAVIFRVYPCISPEFS